MLALDWVVVAIYILAAGAAGWWMDKAGPSKDVMRRYSLLTTMMAMIPFVSVKKLGISDEHARGFEESRLRLGIACAILTALGLLNSIYFWFRFA